MSFKSVSAIEIPIGELDKEIVLNDREIIGFEVKNKGTATLTLFTNTVLESEDCWSPPQNNLGIVFSGRIRIKWGSTGTKQAFVYALVGQM